MAPSQQRRRGTTIGAVRRQPAKCRGRPAEQIADRRGREPARGQPLQQRGEHRRRPRPAPRPRGGSRSPPARPGGRAPRPGGAPGAAGRRAGRPSPGRTGTPGAGRAARWSRRIRPDPGRMRRTGACAESTACVRRRSSTNACRGSRREGPVAPAVVAELVPLGDRAAAIGAVRERRLAEHEEGRPGPRRGEDVEDPRVTSGSGPSSSVSATAGRAVATPKRTSGKRRASARAGQGDGAGQPESGAVTRIGPSGAVRLVRGWAVTASASAPATLSATRTACAGPVGWKRPADSGMPPRSTQSW